MPSRDAMRAQHIFPFYLRTFPAFLFLHLASALAVFSQTWQQLADFPGTARDDGVVFVIGNNAYCLTGLQVGWSCTRDGYVFDGGSETWSAMDPMPAGSERQYACAFSYNSYGYVFGGVDCSGKALADLWRYDPADNSWQALSPLPDSGRAGSSCFVLGDRAYIIGGKTTAGTILPQVWEYTIPAGNWQRKNDLPFPGSWRGCGFAADTTGYTAYGLTAVGYLPDSIYSYDRTADAWKAVPGMATEGRTYTGCAVIAGKACFYGGVDSAGILKNDFAVFDPAVPSLTWYAGIPAAARKGGMAFSLNGSFYYTTGIDANNVRLKETWRNDSPLLIAEKETGTMIRVIPNPFEAVLSVSAPAGCLLRMYDMTGKLVLAEEIAGTKNIGTGGLGKGLYLVSLTRQGQPLLRKKMLKL